ncbi:hypothetical protein L6R53_05540 [Myxococcota bacterium]|nr:hypothetical protein [Myxococcota bacterium]
MARPSPRLIGAFVAVGVAAWAAAFVVDQVLARALALPEGATLIAPGDAALAVAPDGGEADPDATTTTARTSVTSGRRPTRDALIGPIVKRSIFDSTKVGASADGTPANDGPEAKSDLDATLLATVVADPPEYSSALIARKGGDDAKGYGIGDDLWGEGTVVGIEPKRVIIERSDGSREFIAMGGEAQVKKSTTRSLREGEGEGEEGVEQTGENKFVVDAALVEEALKDPEKLASQVRVAPHKDENGQIDGYRMSGIRRNSLFKKLGIKNGDVVHSVNGQPLTSMQSAMSAYESLQNDKNFSFEITRRNQRQTFEYEIR